VEYRIAGYAVRSGMLCCSYKGPEHQNRVSLDKSLTVNYFGRKMTREDKLKNTERTS